MDRRNAYRLLITVATLAVAGAAAQTAGPPITDARWIAPGHDMLGALTTEPGECLALPDDAGPRLSVEIGRAAFRNPLLLGGVAARVGLACASCHRAGHDNPDFTFPGLSGAPGTADTTSAVTSEQRDDGRFNPKPIPSLVAGEGTITISRTEDRALERFIHAVVVEEFDGAEPPPAVLTGLASYVRALRRDACPARRVQPVTIAGRLDDAARAIDAGAQASAAGDAATARMMTASARAMLGSVAERLSGPALAAARGEITQLGADLGRLEEGAPSAAEYRRVRNRLRAAGAKAADWQALSLFDPDRLRAALE